jgi:hypothetical protein
MNDGDAVTRTQDKVLTDRVYESPVDRYQARFRRRAGIIALVVVLLVLVILS